MIFTMNHTHYDESGKKIVLQGIRKNNKIPKDGWRAMQQAYYEHFKKEYDLEYPKGRSKTR